MGGLDRGTKELSKLFYILKLGQEREKGVIVEVTGFGGDLLPPTYHLHVINCRNTSHIQVDANGCCGCSEKVSIIVLDMDWESLG